MRATLACRDKKVTRPRRGSRTLAVKASPQAIPVKTMDFDFRRNDAYPSTRNLSITGFVSGRTPCQIK
jgi:hypothetical protein